MESVWAILYRIFLPADQTFPTGAVNTFVLLKRLRWRRLVMKVGSDIQRSHTRSPRCAKPLVGVLQDVAPTCCNLQLSGSLQVHVRRGFPMLYVFDRCNPVKVSPQPCSSQASFHIRPFPVASYRQRNPAMPLPDHRRHNGYLLQRTQVVLECDVHLGQQVGNTARQGLYLVAKSKQKSLGGKTCAFQVPLPPQFDAVSAQRRLERAEMYRSGVHQGSVTIEDDRVKGPGS